MTAALKAVARSSKRLRAIMAGTVALVVAGTALGITHVVREKDEPAQESFCWGTLDARDAASLSAERAARYVSDDTQQQLGSVYPFTCLVGPVKEGANSPLQTSEFSVTVQGLSNNFSVGSIGDEIVGATPSRTPIQGVPGWLTPNHAGVLLPDSCNKKLRLNGAAYVRIESSSRAREAFDMDGAFRSRLLHLLMKSATGISKKLDCSDGAFVAPENTPPAITPSPLASDETCELPGFTAFSSSKVPFSEFVTSGDYRMWSCSLIATEEIKQETLLQFTITQEAQLLRLARGTTGRSASLLCDGKETLLEVNSAMFFKRRAGSESVLPEEKLFENFKKAVSKKSDCTPLDDAS
ncbi:hypothetical protein [Streptomyces corynorhini]|uniref:hypothetical protein n=1 Tax=Streptomyces corynorhini TaxID=2282652 RepID=UPI0011C082BA|nr:hypothetical protein [Streptomyces corynorhini]